MRWRPARGAGRFSFSIRTAIQWSFSSPVSEVRPSAHFFAAAFAVAVGFTAFTEKQILPMMSSRYAYRELLKQIVHLAETRQSPLSDAEMVEVVAFQVAAKGSHPPDWR